MSEECRIFAYLKKEKVEDAKRKARQDVKRQQEEEEKIIKRIEENNNIDPEADEPCQIFYLKKD